MRATTRPGHQAAAVAPRTATKTIATSRVQGRLSGSMRWPTAGSSVGTSASQIARPRIAPINAPIAPTTAPPVSSTSRRCFSVAPIAASAPSWRSRRCAMTAKPAAATSVARSRKTVATENIASASAPRSLWPSLGPHEARTARCRRARSMKAPTESARRPPGPSPGPVLPRTRGRRGRTRRSDHVGSRRCRRLSGDGRRGPAGPRSRVRGAWPRRR